MPQESAGILREGTDYGMQEFEVVWAEVLGKTIEKGMRVELRLNDGGKVVGFVRKIVFVNGRTDFQFFINGSQVRKSDIAEVTGAGKLPF